MSTSSAVLVFGCCNSRAAGGADAGGADIDDIPFSALMLTAFPTLSSVALLCRDGALAGSGADSELPWRLCCCESRRRSYVCRRRPPASHRLGRH